MTFWRGAKLEVNEMGEVVEGTELWTNPTDTKIPEGIGEPFAYRVLIMPITPPLITKGGLILPQTVGDAQDWLNYVGRLAAIGRGAFKHRKFRDLGLVLSSDFPKVGDVVLYARHAPFRLEFKGAKFVVVNDDEIIHLPTTAEGWKVVV